MNPITLTLLSITSILLLGLYLGYHMRPKGDELTLEEHARRFAKTIPPPTQLKDNFYIPGTSAIAWHKWLDEFHPEITKLHFKTLVGDEVRELWLEFIKYQEQNSPCRPLHSGDGVAFEE